MLRQVIPTADRTKATVTVKVSILDKDRLIKPEMSCNVTFLAPPKKGEQKEAVAQRIVTIPKDAITTRNGKPVVYVIDNNKETSSGGDRKPLERPSHHQVWIGRNGKPGEQSAAESGGWHISKD